MSKNVGETKVGMGDQETHLSGPKPPASADPLPGGEPAHEDPIAPGQDPGDQIVSPRPEAPEASEKWADDKGRVKVIEWLRSNGYERYASDIEAGPR